MVMNFEGSEDGGDNFHMYVLGHFMGVAYAFLDELQ
jgi:hypothetical protein